MEIIKIIKRDDHPDRVIKRIELRGELCHNDLADLLQDWQKSWVIKIQGKEAIGAIVMDYASKEIILS
jgi:hypothetical protein